MSTASVSDPIIDWHAHWVPPEVLTMLAGRDRPPRLETGPEGRFLCLGDGRTCDLREAQHDLDRRRDAMAQAGVTRQVLSLAVVGGVFPAQMPLEAEIAVAEANNRGLARLVRQDRRFGGLATLPAGAPEIAARMLERAIGDQGLAGGVLPAEAFADDETARRQDPVLAVADRLGAQIFLHPGPVSGAALPPENGDDPLAMIRRRASGFQDALTAAAITLCYGQGLDRFPRAVVRLANLGGNLALLAERIAMTADRMGLPAGHAERGAGRVVVDTASFSAHGITLAARTLGIGRMVFGSDCPALKLAPGLDGVREAAIGADERTALLSGAALHPGTKAGPGGTSAITPLPNRRGGQ